VLRRVSWVPIVVGTVGDPDAGCVLSIERDDEVDARVLLEGHLDRPPLRSPDVGHVVVREALGDVVADLLHDLVRTVAGAVGPELWTPTAVQHDAAVGVEVRVRRPVGDRPGVELVPNAVEVGRGFEDARAAARRSGSRFRRYQH